MDLMGLMQVESLGGKRYVFYSTKSPTEVISIPTADLLVISLENNSGDITSTSLSGSKPLVPSIHIEGVNFSETFAHVARLEAIQLILRFACIHQGFVDMINPKHAYKLSKNLNGLKQAPNAWYEYLLKFLSQQEKYARNIVKKFGLEKAKFKCTSATFDFKVSQDDSRNKVDESLYRSIIGSLLYLTASRLNIAFAMGIGLVARKIERVLLFDATRRYPYKAFGDFCFESLRARLGVCRFPDPQGINLSLIFFIWWFLVSLHLLRYATSFHWLLLLCFCIYCVASVVTMVSTRKAHYHVVPSHPMASPLSLNIPHVRPKHL
ncbi:putative mitochondrial protein [Cucumis melo var. makuwa]|uniref:Mitochondrial protein n=1 Tax=Cucumis melo var. makuwa TaxID=1194695 RepID=A0A5A7TDS0_CUCMM|nr:putative mitochondrial protein [Cucumis melo var. makuwa]